MTIQERANNKIWSKIQMAQIHLDDLKNQLKKKTYRPFIDEEQMISMIEGQKIELKVLSYICLLYTSPSPRDATLSRMPSSA